MIFYGRNVVIEALKSNYNTKKVYLQKNINVDTKIHEILNLSKKNSYQIEYKELKELASITKSKDHQGVAIELDFSIGKILVDDSENSSYIYISEATFEHNIGAIIRSAELSGLKGVILPKNIKLTGVAARTSAGAIFHIPIFQESIYNAIKKFKKNNFKVFGIERDGINYFEEDLKGNILFIIGGEDKSLSDGVRKNCDSILEIPQEGEVNSLNMSVATGIVLFDRVRQNHISK